MKEEKVRENIQNLGEEEVVRRLVKMLPQDGQVLVGPGDDCAVVDAGGEELLLLKTDAVVSGVHFLPETDSARVGWKAAARVVSDFGAMGGGARELLVTIAAVPDCEMAWVEGLYRGLTRCAQQFGASIVGGETVGLPAGSPAMVSVAGTGRVKRDGFVTRAGGAEGEGLFVTGRLGGSFASGRHLDFVPRVQEGQWLAQHATAMMDLSDGLRRDLPRMAVASDCGFELDLQRLPRHKGCSVSQALGDGEDMELLLAGPRGDWEEDFRRVFPELDLTWVGQLTEKGRELGLEGEGAGWEHFKER